VALSTIQQTNILGMILQIRHFQIVILDKFKKKKIGKAVVLA
jgi:hypothetical protein